MPFLLRKAACFQILPFFIALFYASANEPVAHYRFDERSGKVLVDSSGNGIDGSIVNRASLDVDGRIGSGFRPGPDKSCGQVPQGGERFGISDNSPRTIAFWFRSPSFGDGNKQLRILNMGSSDVRSASKLNIGIESGKDAKGENLLGIRFGNGNVFFGSDEIANPFSTDTWYHVAIVYDGTTSDFERPGKPSDDNGLICYVNGTKAGVASSFLKNQKLQTGASDIDIGADHNQDRVTSEFPGVIDELIFYKTALNESQVSALSGRQAVRSLSLKNGNSEANTPRSDGKYEFSVDGWYEATVERIGEEKFFN